MSTSNCVQLCIRKQQTEQIINMEETRLKAQESGKKTLTSSLLLRRRGIDEAGR